MEELEESQTNNPVDFIESSETALNEYYKLKSKYEAEIMKNKKTIMNNSTLSSKEKRQEYLKLKPKCINCKRPGGTIFSVNYSPVKKNENIENEHKEFRARCGIIADPCNLNITIKIGLYESLPEIINNIESEIKVAKNNIIDNKNKLLFGYITTETALEDFDYEKKYVNEYTSLLESYLNIYIKITDNAEKKTELNENLEKSYEVIEKIKESIKLYNETENTQYVKDVVNMYTTTLQPLLRKIMALKYKHSFVYYNTDNNTYHLIQNINTIKSLEYSSFLDKVVDFDVGLKIKPSVKPKKTFELKIPVQPVNKFQTKSSLPLVIESDSESDSESNNDNENHIEEESQ
jgi:hypothetical protein